MDKLLCGLERDSELSLREVEGIRGGLRKDIQGIQRDALDKMSTGREGRARVLLPTRANIQSANLASTRTRERFSNFRLQWLDKANLDAKIKNGFTRAQQAEFHRHSNRLARNAKEFLQEIAELEPSLQEEVDATIAQIDDASMDLLKLELSSWTKVQENLGRSVNGRMRRVAAGDAIRTYDLNRNLWNLSLLEHPKAVTRTLLANAQERMQSAANAISRRVTTKPKRSMFVAGVCPDGVAVSRMTPESRTATIAWRIFSPEDLIKQAAKRATQVQGVSTFRGLGMAPNTREFYVPVPPGNVAEVEEIMRERRSQFLKDLKNK